MRAAIKMFMMDYARSDPLPLLLFALSPPITGPSPTDAHSLIATWCVLWHFRCGTRWGRLWLYLLVVILLVAVASVPRAAAIAVCGHGHCGWRHSQIVNVKVKSVAHKMVIKVLQIARQLIWLFAAATGELCTHRNEGILKFYGQRQTLARQQLAADKDRDTTARVRARESHMR